MALLERFYDPSEGKVLVNGKDLRRLGVGSGFFLLGVSSGFLVRGGDLEFLFWGLGFSEFSRKMASILLPAVPATATSSLQAP